MFAAVVSFVWTSERFGPRAAAGALLILAGMLAAELLPARRLGGPGADFGR